MKSNYGDIFSFPTKLKFDDSSISTKLFVRQVNFFEVIRLNVEIFCAFEVRSEVTNILITRDNILYRKCIYLQKKKKNEDSIFKHNVKLFRKSPWIYSHLLSFFQIGGKA